MNRRAPNSQAAETTVLSSRAAEMTFLTVDLDLVVVDSDVQELGARVGLASRLVDVGVHIRVLPVLGACLYDEVAAACLVQV